MFTILLTLDQAWEINTRLWLTTYLQDCAMQAGVPEDMSTYLPWTMTEERLTYFGGKVPDGGLVSTNLLDTT